MNISINSFELNRLKELVLARTGLTFGLRNSDVDKLKIISAAQNNECNNMEEFYHLLLESTPDSALWEDLVSVITVGETYFFRNENHFDALRRHILPDLIARRRNDRRLRIWSAGCATGQEPYSIAILLRELLPDLDRWNIFILATDINNRFLAEARAGRYNEWSFRRTEPDIQKRYFRKRDEHFVLSPKVRKMVAFAYLNLVDDSHPSLVTNTGVMDLIMCRNVTIYFPDSQIQKNAEKFYGCLAPEGYLVVGAAETNSELYSQFKTLNISDAFIYQKTAKTISPAAFPVPKSDEKPRPGLLKKKRAKHRSISTPAASQDNVSGRKHPQTAVQSGFYEKGMSLEKEGYFYEALACFQEHLKHEPASSLTYYQIARIKANAGFLEEALSCAKQSTKLNPLLVEAHYALGCIQQERNKIDKAIKQFNKVLFLNSDFILAHFSLAGIYKNIERKKDATRHRKQAIRLIAKTAPEEEIPGSGGLTGTQLMSMLRTLN